jgi:hypothetical protein
VTVYPGNALVTREVEVPPGEGLTELVVPDMPVRIQNSSLYSESANGLRVLSTRFRSRPVEEDTREGVRRLEDDIRKYVATSQKVQADLDALSQNLMMLTKLEKFTEGTAAHAADKAGVNGDAAITMAKYVMDHRAEKMREKVVLQQQLDMLKEQMAFTQRKLRDLTAGSTRLERDAVIVVDREGGAGGTVRLNYLVDKAGWHPQYKLRAGATGKDAVKVDYLAAISQQSGEDWSGVELTLSTAQPMLNAAPPELAKLQVAVVASSTIQNPPGVPNPPGQPGLPGLAMGGFAPQAPMELARRAKDLRRQAFDSYNLQDVTNGSKQINEAAALEQNWELMKSREEIIADNRKQPIARGGNTEGPSVTYHLKSRLTIPSRNDDQVIEVTKLSLEPKYYYKAVPVLNRHVYRLADLANNSTYVLLPGEATMYQGTDFVGRMTMPLVAIGEEFTAGFGVDPQLQIQRQMLDKNKTTQGGNQVLKYEYRILVSSYKAEPVQLQVWDRLPFAETETAGVTLLKTTPALSKDGLYEREGRPSNLLRWDLEVRPHTSGERAVAINYEFKLELDRNMAISGLLAR